jgi:hypothetical protein
MPSFEALREVTTDARLSDETLNSMETETETVTMSGWAGLALFGRCIFSFMR